MAISIAFFGLGIGGLMIYLIRNKIKTEKLPSKILQSSIAFAVSLPIFLFVIGHIIPPSTSFIYLFYLSSSIPFFLAGVSMALVYLAMPNQVTKLYFADLTGAAAATLILDPLLQRLGAESLILFIGILIVAPSVISAAAIRKHTSKSIAHLDVIQKKSILYGLILVSVSSALLAANLRSNIIAIPPSENKGLHSMLSNPSNYKDLSTQWNSFSRIDVIQYNFTGADAVGSILIDADALTPILKWNGSSDNIQWLKRSMDYMPYEISNANPSNSTTTLVIGSGGGEDILVALAAGSKNITAVEINPLIISAVKDFGSNLAGNLYDRKDVKLFIDDGRHFISSTTSKYDTIVIKLVDSWAAQLAGGYALSENYLYTVEAFKQYLSHLNGDNGKLVLVRWNTELPRLIPLVVESLRQQEVGKRSIQDISNQIVVVEDRPGLTFGSNNQTTLYPVLVIIKNSPFTNSELNLVKERIARDGPKVIAMPGGYVQPPYDSLLISDDYIGGRGYRDQYQQKQQQLQAGHYDPNTSSFRLKPPTDDSPFYFAKELIPQQLVSLIETAVGVSAVLALLLVYYSKLNRIKLTSSSRFHIMFVIFIGLGFIFLEITFIQKFLLLLGTPIMALTVILFSILLSGGIGAYLSGRLFSKNPYKAVVISIPILAAIVLAYYVFLTRIIDSSIILQLYQRIALTFALLSPPGLLMGFQFPSITRMYSASAIPSPLPEEHHGNQDITLLWGVNVTASVLGTVITATTSMVIGFNGNLLIGFGLYLGALASAIAATKIAKQIGSQEVVK
jgi:Spermine/spermidine synthase domain